MEARDMRQQLSENVVCLENEINAIRQTYHNGNQSPILRLMYLIDINDAESVRYTINETPGLIKQHVDGITPFMMAFCCGNFPIFLEILRSPMLDINFESKILEGRDLEIFINSKAIDIPDNTGKKFPALMLFNRTCSNAQPEESYVH